jgi:Na+/melibiose symporter-like transporter
MGYGVGAIAYALPYQIMASFFLFFVTSILHIPPAIAGTIVAVSVFWDAITDPWIGALSDRTNSKRFGRRHQYLLLGGFGTALGSWFLWSISPETDSTLKIILLLGAVLFTKTMNTFYGAPYYALGGSISRDYDVRSSLQGWRAAFHVIGMILALVGTQILFFRGTPEFPRGQLNPAAYPKIGLAVAIVTTVIAVIAYLLIPKDHGNGAPKPTANAWKMVKAALANKSFRAILLVIFVIEASFQIMVSLGTHVNTFTYHLTGPQMGILGLSLLGMSVISQPFWVFMCRKFEKRTALILGMILGLIGFIGMPWAHVGFGWLPIDAPNTLLTLSLFSMVAGIGNGAFMSIPFSMVADSADQGQLDTDHQQEGLYFGLYTFAYKLGISVSVFIGGILLDMIGFVSEAKEQTSETAYQLAITPTWLLMIATPVILWAIIGYRIDRSKHAETLSKLEAKNG